MKKIICMIALAMLSIATARADSLVIYKPYVTQTYQCNPLTAEGAPAFGEVRGVCTSVQNLPFEDFVFTNDFESFGGGWNYIIQFQGRELVQDGCAMLIFSETTVALSCS